MAAGRLITRSDAAHKPVGYGRVEMTHFKASFSPDLQAFLVSYVQNLHEKLGGDVEISLDTRALKDAMNADRLSVVIDEKSPILAGRTVFITKAGFLNENGEQLEQKCFQITVPHGGPLGWSTNFKFIRDSENGPRMYIN